MSPTGPVTIHPIDVRYSDETTQRCAPWLTTPERDYAATLASRRRQQFIQARATLRALLAETVGVGPRDITIEQGPNGKPAIRILGQLEVSISHTDGVSLIALAEGRRIGVDVERVRAFSQLDALAERLFGASDATAVATTPADARPAVFHELWTRAEAYAKAIGIGLSLDFASSGPFLGSKCLESSESWQLERLDLGPELAAAVAYSGTRDAVEVLAWKSADDVLERRSWCAHGD